MMTTSGKAPPTHSELSSMKLDELREMCKDLGLMVSGKKSDLIQRILGESIAMETESVGIEAPDEVVVRSSNEDVGDAVDRLLARFDKDGRDSTGVVEPTKETIPEPEVKLPEGAPDIPKEGLPEGWTLEQWAHYGNEWLERKKSEEEAKVSKVPTEIMVADIVTEKEVQQPEEADTWSIPGESNEEPLPETPHDTSSMVIVLPSFDVLFENWKPITAVAVAIMIAGAGAFYILSADSSFQARQLRYGDQMTFSIDDGSISIVGDEMIELIRDSTSPSALDEICDEISVDIVSGQGSSVTVSYTHLTLPTTLQV